MWMIKRERRARLMAKALACDPIGAGQQNLERHRCVRLLIDCAINGRMCATAEAILNAKRAKLLTRQQRWRLFESIELLMWRRVQIVLSTSFGFAIAAISRTSSRVLIVLRQVVVRR